MKEKIMGLDANKVKGLLVKMSSNFRNPNFMEDMRSERPNLVKESEEFVERLKAGKIKDLRH